jgi:hypothetical protein
MGWFSRRREGKPAEGVAPTPEELSSVPQRSRQAVRAAVEQCERAREDEFVHAWRELHAVLQTSAGSLEGLLRGAPNPPVRRMVRLTTEELWSTSERWLNAHAPTTSEDMGLMQRALWERVSSAIAVYVETGDQEARERLLRLPDEVDASVDGLEGGPASERQLLMWRLAADEIRGLVNDALVRGGQQV